MAQPRARRERTLRMRKKGNVSLLVQSASVPKASVSLPSKSHFMAGRGSLFVGAMQREAMIRLAAYLRAASRGFAPGKELEDWLAAESDVDQQLARGAMPTFCE